MLQWKLVDREAHEDEFFQASQRNKQTVWSIPLSCKMSIKQKWHSWYFVACHEPLILHTPEVRCWSNARNDVFPRSSHPFDLLRDIDSTPVLQSFEHINSLSFFQVDECTILPCNWYDLQANTHTDSVYMFILPGHMTDSLRRENVTSMFAFFQLCRVNLTNKWKLGK